MVIHDESFNNSFIFDFQLGFLDALSFLKHLVSGDVLSFYISNKVMFNATIIFEEAIGSKFNYTHTSFIAKSNAKFPKFYWGLTLTWRIQWWCQFFQIWCRLRVIDCLRPKYVNPDFINNVLHFDFFYSISSKWEFYKIFFSPQVKQCAIISY